MSYLVLARKYRPRDFSGLVGQDHIVRALTNALEQGRLHHAWMFTGTRGVGKTTISRILAKSLNCTGADGNGGITSTPCGVCPACRQIDTGRFVDYTELDAASNRGVDEVQSLLEQAVYKPVEGRFKVFMIDEVHMLSNTAFNAMLKTLEEPPEYLKFVLATTDPQKVPVTVLSRCLQFNLRPMAPEVIMAHLHEVLAAEQIEAESAALRLLAQAAHGSMRDGLSLADQAIAFGSGQLLEADVRQMLGSVDRSVVFRVIDALADGDGRAVVDVADDLRAAGQSAAAVLEDMARVLQRMAVAQASPSAAVDESDPDAAEVTRLATRLPPDETQLLYSLCIHGRAELGLAPDEYVGLTMALLRLLPFRQSAEAPVSAPDAAEKKSPELNTHPAPAEVVENAGDPATTPIPEPATDEAPANEPTTEPGTAELVEPGVMEPAVLDEPEPPVESPEPAGAAESTVTHADAPSGVLDVAVEEPRATNGHNRSLDGPLADAWADVVAQLVLGDAVTALTRELALQSEWIDRTTDGRWTLRVASQSLAESAPACERLQAALRAAGHDVQLQVLLGPVTDTPAMRQAIAAQERLKAAEALLRADPFVQEMMQDFGARMVPDSIRAL